MKQASVHCQCTWMPWSWCCRSGCSTGNCGEAMRGVIVAGECAGRTAPARRSRPRGGRHIASAVNRDARRRLSRAVIAVGDGAASR